MRKRHVLARQTSEVTSSGGYPPVRPVRGHRCDPLALPNIDSAVPIILDDIVPDPQWAAIALEWLDAGFVPEDSQESVKKMVSNALQEWLSKNLGQTECLVDMNHCLAENASAYLDWASQTDTDSKESDWLYGISFSAMPVPRFIQSSAEELDVKVPRLMETALYWLGTATTRLAWKSGTPAGFRDQASYLYWQGASSMEEWEEMMEEGEDEGEYFSPDDFDKNLPSWVIDPKPRIGTRRLSHLTHHPDTQVAEIARCCLALSTAVTLRVWMPNNDLVEADLVYPMFFLRWNEEDSLMRVGDDMIEHANQCSDCYTDIACTWEFPKTPEGFCEWKSKAERGFAVLRDINSLIEQISRPGDLS